MIDVVYEIAKDMSTVIRVFTDFKHQIAESFEVLDFNGFVAVNKLAIWIKSWLESNRVGYWFLGFIVLISLAVPSYDVQLELFIRSSLNFVGWDLLERLWVGNRAQDFILLEPNTVHVILVLIE